MDRDKLGIDSIGKNWLEAADIYKDIKAGASVSSTLKWHKITPEFAVVARHNFGSIVNLCDRSCNAADAENNQQDVSVRC